MKKIKLNISLYILTAAFLFAGCDKKTNDSKEANNKAQAEEAHNHEEEGSANKEVELNEAQFKASSIELGTYSMKNLSEVINANGYTKLPPQNQADVSVHMTGIVTSIKIVEGQEVKKGQVLATLESPEFAQLQEAYLTSKNNLEFLELEYDRQKILSEENVNSKKVFQRTKSDYEIEKARFNSLDKQLSMLHLSKTSVNSVMAITAPISGHVTEINITLGANAEVGKPLLTIVDNSKLHVDLLIYEKDLYKVKPGQTVRFILTNQDNTEITGKIFNISKSFENDTKSVAVHADIVNSGQSLIPGMYVNALIDVGKREVQSLPNDAIVRADGREYIFILEEEHEHDKKESHSHDHDHDHDATEGHSHDDGHAHEHDEEEGMYHFQRIEVKTGTSQLGYTQVAVLQKIDDDAKIVLKGAYYIQSHLIKNEGGGEHHH
ncbi:efflux RND transporter periplasmic adaptor subunit [Flavobacterium beibuense]|uniref:Efflux transporter, RND family, MFP subunit n=1 Tax=Flavobacterium beibuense TaxID=657326 RepID=A0A444WG67_9FLAO|nr:efflux RND transporter periplasmic adaptor subunit [Flavobacterium beibuense]RYJ44809.1 Efflux transporter, RND family, MFP subunit [Flavobacterium beibuense]